MLPVILEERVSVFDTLDDLDDTHLIELTSVGSPEVVLSSLLGTGGGGSMPIIGSGVIFRGHHYRDRPNYVVRKRDVALKGLYIPGRDRTFWSHDRFLFREFYIVCSTYRER